MKNITIIAEQISDTALAAAIPADGIGSVTVSRSGGVRGDAVSSDTYRSFRNPNRFRGEYRVDLVVDDAAVDAVFDGIAIAYEAGFFSDAEVWVNDQGSAKAARAAAAA